MTKKPQGDIKNTYYDKIPHDKIKNENYTREKLLCTTDKPLQTKQLQEVCILKKLYIYILYSNMYPALGNKNSQISTIVRDLFYILLFLSIFPC